MKIAIDETFRHERTRFRLRLHCEDCALYDEPRDACAHGYPTREHKRPAPGDRDTTVVFCKDFELA